MPFMLTAHHRYEKVQYINVSMQFRTRPYKKVKEELFFSEQYNIVLDCTLNLRRTKHSVLCSSLLCFFQFYMISTIFIVFHEIYWDFLDSSEDTAKFMLSPMGKSNGNYLYDVWKDSFCKKSDKKSEFLFSRCFSLLEDAENSESSAFGRI